MEWIVISWFLLPFCWWPIWPKCPLSNVQTISRNSTKNLTRYVSRNVKKYSALSWVVFTQLCPAMGTAIKCPAAASRDTQSCTNVKLQSRFQSHSTGLNWCDDRKVKNLSQPNERWSATWSHKTLLHGPLRFFRYVTYVSVVSLFTILIIADISVYLTKVNYC